MNRCLFSLCMLFVTASAFTSTLQPWGRSRTVSTTGHGPRFMFSTDDDKDKAASASASSTIAPNSAPALATMDEPVAAAATTSTATESPKSVVRNMNTGELREVKWVDPAMSANTNPFQMSWWAYIAFGFPFVVLANDAFHFLPTDGPLGFLGRL